MELSGADRVQGPVTADLVLISGAAVQGRYVGWVS